MELRSPITEVKFINEKYAKLLEKLEIFTVKDLITHFPRDYNDSSDTTEINEMLLELDPEKKYLLRVEVADFSNVRIRGGKSFQKVDVFDETGNITATFFNQEYLSRVFKPGKQFLIQGKIKEYRGKLQFSPSNYDELRAGQETIHPGRVSPEYALTTGISKKWFRNRVKSVIDNIDNGQLEIPNELEKIDPDFNVEKYIKKLHFPDGDSDLEKDVEHLSVMELINLQLKLIDKRQKLRKSNYPKIEVKKYEDTLYEFIDTLEFELTKDQKTVLTEILKQLSQKKLVNDLVQGDVGTGKTIIAVIISLLFGLAKFQTVLLAPTTILAKQHFDNFEKLLKKLPVTVELVSSENKRSKKANILIGTTAILSRKKSLIENLGLIIVDEQHRFGVNQREELLKPFLGNNKEKTRPHLLNLSATPIPRTIAESFFGDLDVRIIKTKPKGRKPVKTRLVNVSKVSDMHDWIRRKVQEENEQVYWICPLVASSEKKELKLIEEDINIHEIKSVEDVYEDLSKKFKDIEVGFIHGKMKSKEKNQIMKRFAENELQILISTTVIEVGVDVANATVMVIENAERFGLAGLHQIRGRVGRSDKESWCLLFTASEISNIAEQRLKFFTNNNDGLEIAKFDLETRGPGEVYGTKQSGVPNFKIAKFNNLKLLEESKHIAEKLFAKGVKEIELFS